MNLPLSTELVVRLEEVVVEQMRVRQSIWRAYEGNPMRIEIAAFGRATAFVNLGIPTPLLNVVKLLGAQELEHLDDIVAFYETRGMGPTLELNPAFMSPEFGKALAQRGFYQASFQTMLYGVPTEDIPAPAEGVRVRRMNPEDFPLFGKLYCEGFGMPMENASSVGENNRVLDEHPSFTYYLAEVDGEPAGVASLFVHAGTAYFTAATTTTSLRNLGVQSALLHHRIAEAARFGCDLLCSQARFTNNSLRNMQRAGLQVAYSQAHWNKL
ncbi:GNAT family N-acetyltransferase [Tumebacillus sp. ITR2]|uniref:GNAT family N-acetyltransferase n=1 Tax=Tumebacillus amylolyticus TaxID=2801339 RepID=A0ABS1J959_9BACL|nr:GNAT family N-acetyltransferase [Tumebacillus amylolyticus]MBL0386801.1 GNAT family N-acetyltransferase [Tumebacillus amylolyticus]